ncbi:hypothetical protein B4U79_19093, partial [Dinothrombium tinctorium]
MLSGENIRDIIFKSYDSFIESKPIRGKISHEFVRHFSKDMCEFIYQSFISLITTEPKQIDNNELNHYNRSPSNERNQCEEYKEMETTAKTTKIDANAKDDLITPQEYSYHLTKIYSIVDNIAKKVEQNNRDINCIAHDQFMLKQNLNLNASEKQGFIESKVGDSWDKLKKKFKTRIFYNRESKKQRSYNFNLCQPKSNECVISNDFTGFNINKSYYRNSRGGGVCIGVKNCITSKKHELNISESECISTIVYYGIKKFLFVTLYLSPDNNKKYEVIKEIINSVKNLTVDNIFIFGDWNINFLSTDKIARKIIDIMYLNGFCLRISSPTFPVSNPIKLFDVLFSKDTVELDVQVIPNISNTCDHLALITTIPEQKETIKLSENFKNKYNFKAIDDELMTYDWKEICRITPENDINCIYENIVEIISNVIYKHTLKIR